MVAAFSSGTATLGTERLRSRLRPRALMAVAIPAARYSHRSLLGVAPLAQRRRAVRSVAWLGPSAADRGSGVGARRDRRTTLVALGAADHVATGFLIRLERQELARLRLFQQFAEGTEAVVALVEARVTALERLLDHRAPDLLVLVALLGQRVDRVEQQVERFLPAIFVGLLCLRLWVLRSFRRRFRRLAPRALLLLALVLPHEIVVVDELVAVRDQQVRGRALHADADDELVVLAQLADERREVRVAADDHERVDVLLRVAQVERVHDHADVGGVLAGHAHVRDLDHLERRFVHRRLELAVALPVAVRLLHHDAALQQQALQHAVDVELRVLGVAHAQRDVLEIAEQGHAVDRVGHYSHPRRLKNTYGMSPAIAISSSASG